MKQIKLFALCLTVIFAGQLAAQTDPHFTQNYTYPMYINPAMTGGSDGEYRVSGVYRGQWGSITNPYRTTGVSFDTRTSRNLALGLNVLNQSAGDGGFNYFSSAASFAYTGVKFGKTNDHHIVLAMQFGLINRSVDQTKFKWGEQWNPITGYNASNPVSEIFAATAATTLDVGAGALYYDAGQNKKANVFGGFSVYHLNKPKDPIISSQSTALNTIPMRYAVHGGISLNIAKHARIIPHAMFMQQGTARETMIGAYAELNVNAETDLMIGGYYRLNDAFAPFAGFNWKNLIVGVSYDVNASKLSSMNRNVNSFEISFSYIKRKASKSIVDFVPCPRL